MVWFEKGGGANSLLVVLVLVVRLLVVDLEVTQLVGVLPTNRTFIQSFFFLQLGFEFIYTEK